jgi:hypothetical protein
MHSGGKPARAQIFSRISGAEKLAGKRSGEIRGRPPESGKAWVYLLRVKRPLVVNRTSTEKALLAKTTDYSPLHEGDQTSSREKAG